MGGLMARELVVIESHGIVDAEHYLGIGEIRFVQPLPCG